MFEKIAKIIEEKRGGKVSFFYLFLTKNSYKKFTADKENELLFILSNLKKHGQKKVCVRVRNNRELFKTSFYPFYFISDCFDKYFIEIDSLI